MQDAAEKDIPKGRAGYLYEIAGPVLMLASPAGNFFNGESIRIDGGWLLVRIKM
jgi:NAD(P)-dependent dehydrogenase (short-subunit alcohol dehydrogenase family)